MQSGICIKNISKLQNDEAYVDVSFVYFINNNMWYSRDATFKFTQQDS